MAILKCKMCGGDIILNEEKTFGTCKYCGSTMTLPKVSDDQRANMFNRGNHFRRMGEFDKMRICCGGNRERLDVRVRVFVRQEHG